MDPVAIIERFYPPGSLSHRILLEHGRLVAQKALAAAARVPHLNPDLAFVEAAAMLHDIGIFLTHSPGLGCAGKEPYIRHGILGRSLLDEIGLPRHGLVCERHVGVGISREDIRRHRLPLPARDMLPLSIEEQIICFADKFFSKDGNGLPSREKSVARILESLRPHGGDKVERFQQWAALFA
ncbi:MAG: HD domain-containing protein [Desulfobacterales bacterium]|nr:HD domain-containing protein [Desulfobacterales bacterium]